MNMFPRKGWLSGGIWKVKNPHSLDNLKYLYHQVLLKNSIVTEQNQSLLVETLRSISEILIWGDQNDSTVVDFFLEKNILGFFLRYMGQKSGRFICTQLLQTLNILFENIKNETSIYYLLSNNHINSIIVHKFDFSNEEVMAYYISFLKTLSLKLNNDTIHFFFNEHTNDFALYTEAIKFFNHSETMVRIAVRTITLNVYRVLNMPDTKPIPSQTHLDDKSMLRYIRDKTAAPYFSNLVWFIGNHIIDLDICVRNDSDHNNRLRLSDLVAEHLDHFHYLNDILNLKIEALNDVLTDQLLNRLFIPLYIYSLTGGNKYKPRDERPRIDSLVSLFLLSQVFLIISHKPLVSRLAEIIFSSDVSICEEIHETGSPLSGCSSYVRGFIKPEKSLSQILEMERRQRKKQRKKNMLIKEGASSISLQQDMVDKHETQGNKTPSSDLESSHEEFLDTCNSPDSRYNSSATGSSDSYKEKLEPSPITDEVSIANCTDEEKLLMSNSASLNQFSLDKRPFLKAVFSALNCENSDYQALFALCLLYALGRNQGINQDLLDRVFMPTDKSKTKDHYNVMLMELLISIISCSCDPTSRVRLATLEMSIILIKQLVLDSNVCFLKDLHLASIEGAREESTLILRNFYKVWEKSEEIFLDMFEDEFREMKTRPLNVEWLMEDASILLPPTGTPLTGIDFNKRLPCGEVERARRAMRVFFMLRSLSLTLRSEVEKQLPLTKEDECVKINDVLDLNNSDLIACTVITRDKKERRFLVIDVLQLILVEPDTRRLGWGVVKFVGFLQDVEVTGDKDDSRSLHITIHKPSMNVHARPLPLLSAKFTFDDHIRCLAAKQRLTKGRLRARQRKMQMIARLVELPSHIVEPMYQPLPYSHSAADLRPQGPPSISGRSHQGRSSRHSSKSIDIPKQSSFSLNINSTSDRNKSYTKFESTQPIPIHVGMARRQVIPPEFEEAVEAIDSSEIVSQSKSIKEDKKVNVSKSKESKAISKTLPQDIPLKEFSQRGKAVGSSTECLSSRNSKSRSSSCSPHKTNESPIGNPALPPSPLALRLQKEKSLMKDSHPTFVSYSSSNPSKNDILTISCKSRRSKSLETGSRSNLSVCSNPANDIDNKSVSNDSKSKSRNTKVNKPPKTLTPAETPPISLINASSCLDSSSVSSLKILPPADPEQVFSDISSTNSFESDNQNVSVNMKMQHMRMSDLYPDRQVESLHSVKKTKLTNDEITRKSASNTKNSSKAASSGSGFKKCHSAEEYTENSLKPVLVRRPSSEVVCEQSLADVSNIIKIDSKVSAIEHLEKLAHSNSQYSNNTP